MSCCNRPRTRLGRAAEQIQIFAVLVLLAGFAGLALFGLVQLVARYGP